MPLSLKKLLGRKLGASDGDSLVELALDLRWSWNHATDELWRRLGPIPLEDARILWQR